MIYHQIMNGNESKKRTIENSGKNTSSFNDWCDLIACEGTKEGLLGSKLHVNSF